MTTIKPRRQCAKCPWKTSTDPCDIPNGYDEGKHRALSSTIAEPGALRPDGLRMACHETPQGKELPCVGWLVNQLGPGNNIGLRFAVATGRIDGNVRTVGPQHERFEDTLPRPPIAAPSPVVIPIAGATGPMAATTRSPQHTKYPTSGYPRRRSSGSGR